SLFAAEANPVSQAPSGAHERCHMLREPQDGVDRADHPLELRLLSGELLSAGGGERVVSRAAIVVRRAPLGAHVAVEEEALEGGVEGAFADLEYVLGDVAQSLGDAVAVHRLGAQGAKDEEVKGTGEQLGLAGGSWHAGRSYR